MMACSTVISPGMAAGRWWRCLMRRIGPYAPEQGHRFNPNKCLLDPYAKEIYSAHLLACRNIMATSWAILDGPRSFDQTRDNASKCCSWQKRFKPSYQQRTTRSSCL
jgi:pullulanase/glycogen debranching enzyme